MPKKDHASNADSRGQSTAADKTQKAKPDGQTKGTVTAATAGPVVNVSNVEQLYEAVNEPSNAGASIFLSRGTYELSENDLAGKPRLNGGRLDLQPDMKLYGVVGQRSAVTIETRNLPAASFQTDAISFRLCSINAGRGSHAIEWLTILGNPDAAAGIGTDPPLADMAFPSAPKPLPQVTVRVVEVDSRDDSSSQMSRGIDIRNLGAVMNGRKIVAEIKGCDFSGHRQGIRIMNADGVKDSQIHAVMSRNQSHGNKTGCLIANNRATQATIEVYSSGDTFDDNGAGCIVVGGLTMASRTTSNDNRTQFKANGSFFVKNQRTEFEIAQGGIAVLGGEAPNVPGGASGNKVNVRLEDCKVGSNQTPNFPAWGARTQSTTPGVVAGINNSVTIELLGSNWNTPPDFIAPSKPDEIGPPTNTVTVTRL